MAINIKKYNHQKKTPSNTSKKQSSTIKELLNKDINLFGNPFNAKEKQSFYANLETLLTAGLDIQRALKLIQEGVKKRQNQAVLVSLHDSIVEGAALSEAMEIRDVFTDYEVQTIRIGEETGRLSIVLQELADFFEKSMRYRRQLIGALSYPLFVSGFAILVVFFLLRFLVPMFSGVYGRFGQDLPFITQQIVNISEWLESYSYLIFLFFGGLVAFLFSQKERGWFKKWSAILLIRMPIFGKIIKQIYLARFCQSMALLLHSKVPLLRAVELVRAMINFYPIEIALEAAEKGIIKGDLLSHQLRLFKLFPSSFLALIEVGEEASQLENMFSKLSSQYNEKVDQQTEVIGRLIEPILIVGLGLLVGIILIAMYLPLFQLSTTVG
jgi:type IV pilus assembly protein PilC